MKLSDKLIELRKTNGWSQEDFAEKLDVSRQAISRWENGTALPDAQNIFRISRLFNVTADYLLNDDYESGTVAAAPELPKERTEEVPPPVQRKRPAYWLLIPAVCLAALTAFVIITVVNNAQSTSPTEEHAHPVLNCVKENELAPTCKAEGAYDEVVYCVDCGEELLRTRRSTAILDHQFQRRKCIVCGEVLPSEGLLYMPNSNGTCTVDIGTCTDEDIIIPEYSPSGEKVIQIKAYAFAGNKKLKSICIPETVTAIGEGAFSNCINLESVDLPSKITKINSYTFNGCAKLKEVTIPAGVYYIGMEAFADCTACESIVIPASVSKIGEFAFKNFSNCQGTVIFEVYSGWKMYDETGDYIDNVDFQNTIAKPGLLLTFKYTEYSWERK